MQSKIFIPDSGNAERVECVLEFTPRLVADEAAIQLIGSEVREVLLKGKNVFVRLVEAREPMKFPDQADADAQ